LGDLEVMKKAGRVQRHSNNKVNPGINSNNKVNTGINSNNKVNTGINEKRYE